MQFESTSNLDRWLHISPELGEVAGRVYTPVSGLSIAPRRDLVFRALELVSPEDVRVVILGQDPYHTPGKATGLAFGYSETYKGPVNSSMTNIVSEIRNSDYYVPAEGTQEFREWAQLLHWAEQGILLLNTRLTVELGKPMSHSEMGWEAAIRPILQYLVEKQDIYWMLWGNEAHNAAMSAGLDPLVEEHRVSTTTHPCRYSHDRGARPFTGSGQFNDVNRYLAEMGKDLIRW